MPKRTIWLATFCLLVLAPLCSTAYTVTPLTNVGNFNDFVLEGGKKELRLNPGQNEKTLVAVINRSGQPLNFSVAVEDFTAQSGVDLEFLGAQKGQYSLKDFLHPEVMSFSLLHGERMELPVEVKVPIDAPPGGLYGAVLISVVAPTVADSEDSAGRVKPVSRLASLYFVRVSGAVEESGELTGLKAEKNLNSSAPVKVGFSFKNTGNIYLNPSGEISLLNFLGQTKEKIKIPAYFVMPETTRTQTLEFTQPKFGWYRVKLLLNPGYGQSYTESYAGFWVLPSWIFTILIVVAVIAVISAIFWLKRRRSKSKTI
ncbi:MAG: hypothetical protein WC473_02580 [Patescibacteria group bacterium]|jgi:hypothetical protein